LGRSATKKLIKYPKLSPVRSTDPCSSSFTKTKSFALQPCDQINIRGSKKIENFDLVCSLRISENFDLMEEFHVQICKTRTQTRKVSHFNF